MSILGDILRFILGSRPPIVPPTKPPVDPTFTRQFNFSVTPTNATGVLALPDGTNYSYASTSGRVSIDTVSKAKIGELFTLTSSADGFNTHIDTYPLGDNGAYELAYVILESSFVALPSLVPVGQYLRKSNNERHTIIECSDFNLFNRFLNGEDITPILKQRSSLGFNTLRVWTAYNIANIGRLVPKEHPDYYGMIPAFLNSCAEFGLYVEFTCFTGPYDGIFANQDEMVSHWEGLIGACQGMTNVYLELVNEADNAPNQGIPMDRLVRPTGVLASHGSNIQDTMPVEPFWDIATYRAAAGEWQRKIGHNADEISDTVPVITNETPRCPDNDSIIRHFYDGAASAALLCAGACFHSVHGKTSQLFVGSEADCAKAWCQGAKSVPLQYQDGQYIHRTDREIQDVIRSYERRLSGGNGWVVDIHS